jgi:hypothetical protein
MKSRATHFSDAKFRWMKHLCCVGALMFIALSAQGCMTTSARKAVVKKKPAILKPNESYALMDDSSNIDVEILKRGNRARGLSEY